MATATGETLDATARVMYRGCSICCAFSTLILAFIVVQALTGPYAPTHTVEGTLALILLMVVVPVLLSFTFYYLSRKREIPHADIDSERDLPE